MAKYCSYLSKAVFGAAVNVGKIHFKYIDIYVCTYYIFCWTLSPVEAKHMIQGYLSLRLSGSAAIPRYSMTVEM